MKTAIVRSPDPVTLVGGGDLAPSDLNDVLELAPVLVAADGGADAALAAGVMPDAVIGDFDSIHAATRARIPPDRLHHVAEQNSTDFDKALRNIEAPLILAVGFLGARLDHQLAALNALVRRADRPCILLGAHEILFHAPVDLSLALSDGDLVSLFPMRRVTGRSTGLRWPIDGLDLAPDGRVGTSNRATGRVRLQLDGPGLLVMVPRAALGTVTRAIGVVHGRAGQDCAPRPARA